MFHSNPIMFCLFVSVDLYWIYWSVQINGNFCELNINAYTKLMIRSFHRRSVASRTKCAFINESVEAYCKQGIISYCIPKVYPDYGKECFKPFMGEIENVSSICQRQNNGTNVHFAVPIRNDYLNNVEKIIATCGSVTVGAILLIIFCYVRGNHCIKGRSNDSRVLERSIKLYNLTKQLSAGIKTDNTASVHKNQMSRTAYYDDTQKRAIDGSNASQYSLAKPIGNSYVEETTVIRKTERSHDTDRRGRCYETRTGEYDTINRKPRREDITVYERCSDVTYDSSSHGKNHVRVDTHYDHYTGTINEGIYETVTEQNSA